jgi:quercetin dioxygenase-like cupin family protein
MTILRAVRLDSRTIAAEEFTENLHWKSPGRREMSHGHRIGFVAIFALVLGASGIQAQTPGASIVRLPDDIVFKGPIGGAPETVVLYGDPKKPGLYVTRVKFSAGWKDKPHWHPDEARTVAVLSGTLYFGSGEKWDETKFKAYPAGTFYSEPPKSPHFTWAKDGDVILQITGIGPSGKTFIPEQPIQH